MATYGILGKNCQIPPESSQMLLTVNACFCVVALVISQCTDTARVTPPTCIALAVLLSVRKLLADRQMGHAKKSVRHSATSR
jgi:hypothetical protein